MVGDYISREAAIRAFGSGDPIECQTEIESKLLSQYVRAAKATLKSIPAADVVEVRHASWIEDGYYNEPCVCSNCGEPCKDTVMGKPSWNYCPNCGAKMDGGQDDG